jgi:hypothetical protein
MKAILLLANTALTLALSINSTLDTIQAGIEFDLKITNDLYRGSISDDSAYDIYRVYLITEPVPNTDPSGTVQPSCYLESSVPIATTDVSLRLFFKSLPSRILIPQGQNHHPTYRRPLNPLPTRPPSLQITPHRHRLPPPSPQHTLQPHPRNRILVRIRTKWQHPRRIRQRGSPPVYLAILCSRLR